MKKLSLILVLFFAYFVCVVDVYAFQPYCSLIDNSSNPGYLYLEDCSFDGLVTVGTKITEDGPNGRYIDYVSNDVYDYSLGTLVTNYNLFGYYESSGNLIPYVRPQYADDWSLDKIHYLNHHYFYSDSYGNTENYIQFNQPKTIDIDFGVQTPVGRTNRLDFAVHFNLTDIPNKFRQNLLDNLQLDVFMPFTSNQSYCTSIRQGEIFHVSCSFVAEQNNPVVRITNTLSDNYTFTTEYNYKMYLDISNWSMVIGPGEAVFNEDYNNIETPNGDLFNDYYSKIQGESADFFGTGFDYSHLNSLTSLLLKPLELLEIDPTPGIGYNLNFTIFHKSFSFDNGYTLFWGKCVGTGLMCPVKRRLNNFYIGSTLYTGGEQLEILNNFKIFWNFLFGGYIIYILIKKAINVTMQVFDPNIMKVGDL